MISWEVAEKCLLFAEGTRDYTLFSGVRGSDFPESLLRTKSKCGNTGDRIAALMDEGKTTYEIAEIVGISQPSVALQTKRIKGKRQFYGEWKEFMESLQIVGAGDCPIADIFTEDKDKSGLAKAEKNGIRTVAAFLAFAVTHDNYTAIKTLATNRERYHFLFVELIKYLKPFFVKPGVDGQISLFDLM